MLVVAIFNYEYKIILLSINYAPADDNDRLCFFFTFILFLETGATFQFWVSDVSISDYLGPCANGLAAFVAKK